MSSLKDALKEAGFKTTVDKKKKQNQQKHHLTKKKGEGNKKIHKHHSRYFCDDCNATSPDVEHYKHSIRTLDAEWLCVMCADKHSIHDDCRQTQQSDFSKRKVFRRGYGPTKRFPRK